MNEKDKKPTHYTTGENGEAVPVYPETAEKTSETVEPKTDSAEISQPEEEAVVNAEVIEDSTKDETAVETGSVETEEAASTETEKVIEAAAPEQSTETSRAEDSNKPTEEDLKKVDLKLDQNPDDPDQERQEVKAATTFVEVKDEKNKTKMKPWQWLGVGAAAVAAVGGALFGASKVMDSRETTKAPSSSSAEANPGNSTEQASNVLSGITVDGTLKEFDTKEQTNVITLQDAKDFSSDTTNTPATQSANEQEPGSPVADYNVKIFDIMLNGSPDEIRELLKNLGLGPQELKDRYDRAIELGTYNEWGDMSEQAYSHKGWPMGQGIIYGNIDTLNPGIMYNRVWAIAIANAVEVTGGDIPPAQPRDAATLAKNRELIESWYGEEGKWTLYFATDDTLKVSDETGEVLTGPQFTNPDDLMVIYIDPSNKDTLILSDIIPTENLTNIAYSNIQPIPANIGEIIPYGYAGPTSISKYVQHSTS